MKKTTLGRLMSVMILIILSVGMAACSDEASEEKTVDNDWITVDSFEVTPFLDAETKALYTVLNALEPNERVTNTGAPILEKEPTLGAKVEIKDVDELSIFKKGTKSLTLTMRSNRLDSDAETIEDTRKKTIKVLKNIGLFMKENKISGIQIEWTLQGRLGNGATSEQIYYILRYDVDTLLKMDWNTATPDNMESYAVYIG